MAMYVETFVGTMGNVGMSGAPIVHFTLDVTMGAGSDQTLILPVSGTASITQAVAPPNGDIAIGPVQGEAKRQTNGTLIINLTNQQATQSLVGASTFVAEMNVGPNWNGTGSYSYKGPAVLDQVKIQQTDVPVRNADGQHFNPGQPQPMYAAAMQQASAGGDLTTMRGLAAEAEKHLADYGNVAMALEVLKVEIGKLTARAG